MRIQRLPGSDNGVILTGSALAGRGIVLKPAFEVADHVGSGAPVPVCEATPPQPIQLACLFPHKRLQDPKSRLFIDFMVAEVRTDAAAGCRLPGMALKSLHFARSANICYRGRITNAQPYGLHVYLMYVDESGDAGNNTQQTRYFCLTGLVVHESNWRNFIQALVQFRKTVKNTYGLPLRTEIHAAEMLRKNQFGIPKHERLAIMRNLLDEIAKLDFVSVTNIVIDKMGKAVDYDIFGVAWRVLFQRFENTLTAGNFPGGYKRSYGVVFTDATSGKKLTQIMRKMSVYNPIPNRFGPGYRDMPIQRIIEDPSERDSRASLPIQVCDVAAYFLYQSLSPNSYIRQKAAHNYIGRLQPILNTHATSKNELGIVKL